ncbi:RNA-guided endonuclease InsQ/TnpB family protein [Streptomyces sp. NPDC050416]|uniref:RNA-guided endonuclease InsQ/TnpB family protein n=1 Tax=Streptomyces sp. NPDC050416 TaxID=3365611 RepID=UPI003792B7A1
MSQGALAKRQFGHRARLVLSPAEVPVAEAQAHAARTMWNLLHAWWQMMPKDKRTLAQADDAVRQARKDLDFLAVLPAQAAQAVLKTYVQAWKNCWQGRADAPNFKGRFRSFMSVDIPQGRDLNIKRVHRRWGMVNLPRIGRIRFRWTKDLPIGKHASTENRISGARLIKNALGWHIAFRVTTLEPKPEPHRGGEVGIDVGVTVPLAVKSARGTVEEPARNVAQKAGLNRSIAAEAWGRTVTMLTYKTARYGGSLVKVPGPGTSQRCSACGVTTAGSRESQAVFVCKNPDCGWSGNADHNAARNILHLYRIGLVAFPAAGRAVVRRARRVKPPTVR